MTRKNDTQRTLVLNEFSCLTCRNPVNIFDTYHGLSAIQS